MITLVAFLHFSCAAVIIHCLSGIRNSHIFFFSATHRLWTLHRQVFCYRHLVRRIFCISRLILVCVDGRGWYIGTMALTMNSINLHWTILGPHRGSTNITNSIRHFLCQVHCIQFKVGFHTFGWRNNRISGSREMPWTFWEWLISSNLRLKILQITYCGEFDCVPPPRDLVS